MYSLVTWDQEEDAHRLDDIWESYAKLAEMFAAAGRKVFVVVEPPRLRARAEDLIFKERYFPANIVGTSRREWEQHVAPDRLRFDQWPKDIVVVDPAPLLCDGDDCFAVKHGVMYYFDANHLTSHGAALVVDKILQSLERGDVASSTTAGHAQDDSAPH